MAKVHVKRIWWRLLRPYRVEWKDAYILCEDRFHSVGPNHNPREIQKVYFQIHPRVQEFLEGLPPVSFLGFKYPSSEYVITTPKRIRKGLILYVDKNGELQVGGKAPVFYVARRSHAIMLRLSCDLS